MAITLEELTARSLLLAVNCKNARLSSATGFLIESGGATYLVSNRHVFTGYRPETGTCIDKDARLPDSVTISHHKAGALGEFVEIKEDLVEADGTSRVLVHPNDKIDVALLPIKKRAEVEYFVSDHHQNTAVGARITVASTVCIIGFPFGLASFRALPIWKTGSIASEVSVPFQNLPCFLVDAATRGGMSGSPVYAVFRGPYPKESGGTVISNECSRFMGIYSGRVVLPKEATAGLSEDERRMIHILESDLAVVWHPTAIDEIVKNGKRYGA